MRQVTRDRVAKQRQRAAIGLPTPVSPSSADTPQAEGRLSEEAVREREAKLRADSEAATRARQAAAEQAQRDEEARRAALMTIFEAARLLSEHYSATLRRLTTESLPSMQREDGSSWIRLGDVERIVLDDLTQSSPVRHDPRLVSDEREVLDYTIAALLFGAPPLGEPATIRMALDPDAPCCPWTGDQLVRARVAGHDVLWACPRPAVRVTCSYAAVWNAAAGEFVPPRIFGGPWVAPIGPLRYPPMTIAAARQKFGEPTCYTLRVPPPPPPPRAATPERRRSGAIYGAIDLTAPIWPTRYRFTDLLDRGV